MTLISCLHPQGCRTGSADSRESPTPAHFQGPRAGVPVSNLRPLTPHPHLVPAHHFVVDFMEVDLAYFLYDVLALERDKPEP